LTIKIGAMSRAALAALGLIACMANASAQDVVDAARAALPDRIKTSGIITVVTSFTYPPYVFMDDNNKPAGIDVEMIELLTKKLGIKAEYTDAKFATLVPSIQSGRFNLGIGEMSITKSRIGIVDFIPYEKFQSEDYVLLVKKDGPEIDPENLCGKKIGAAQGSATAFIIEKISAQCIAEAKPAIEISYYANASDIHLAVSTGRVDGQFLIKSVADQVAKANALLRVADGVAAKGQPGFSGHMINPNAKELRAALILAMESAIKDGSYGAIMAKHNLTPWSITLDELNANVEDIALDR